MDTVEWGTGRPWLGTALPPDRSAGADRPGWPAGWRTRPVAVALLALGVVGLIVAQVVPWGHVRSIAGVPGSGTDPGIATATFAPSLYLDSLPVVAVIAYDLGLLPLLGFAGAALAAQPAVRRPVAFGGIGVGAAVGVLLAGMIRALLSPLSSPSTVVLGGRDVSVSVGLGPYAAGAALCVVLAALILTLREPRRAGVLVAAQRQPTEDVPEQPMDLTVTAAPPVDQHLLGPTG